MNQNKRYYSALERVENDVKAMPQSVVIRKCQGPVWNSQYGMTPEKWGLQTLRDQKDGHKLKLHVLNTLLEYHLLVRAIIAHGMYEFLLFDVMIY